MTKPIKINILNIFFFVIPFFSYPKVGKDDIRLVPGTPEYEVYMDDYHCKQTIRAQRAWISSALLPGLGQIQNREPIRAAVIWGVFAGLFGGAYYCHNECVKYFHDNTQNPPSFVKTYKNVRDALLFMSLLWYIANIFDAYVGAKLLEYDVTDKISVEVTPFYVQPDRLKKQSFGLTFSFNARI